MKTREVTLPQGGVITVPQGIQRIDTRSTHGWQVRYQGTKFFSDSSARGGDPRKALDLAVKELLDRIASLPAPVVLKKGPSAHKSSGLPAGISGPILRQRAGSGVRSAVLSVLLPRFGKEPKLMSIYIGSENTYTERKFKKALARAIELRKAALDAYGEAATRAKRKAARSIRATLKQAEAARG